MKLPHWLVYAPWIAAIGGHDGITILFWTFTRRRMVSPLFRAHEYRHVVQWVVCSGLAALPLGTLAVLGILPWWVLAGSPLGFLVPYAIESFRHGYKGNWFERDAERYATGRRK